MYRVYLRGPAIRGRIKVGWFGVIGGLPDAIQHGKLLLSAMKAGYYILVVNESQGDEVVWDSRKEKE